jgi:glycosyltransferase involved in cell wall biosynthesis
MRRVAKYALTYFGTAGVILLLAGGLLLFTLVDKYNETRKIDILHATATFIVMALGQTMLTAGVVAYVAVRRSYTIPLLPPLPKAETVALIPAYNEEGRVGAVVREAKKYVDLVIVADDGSADNTAKEAEEAGAVVVRHPQNMGKGAAVATLIKAALAADAKYAVLLDADGQHDPADIPKFLQALKSGADHAAGNRFPHTKMPTIRRLGYKALALLHRILIAKLSDPFNGYRALSRKALKTLDQDFDPSYGVETEINYQLRKTKTIEIPIKVKYHEASSKTNFMVQGLNVLSTIIWTAITKRLLLNIVISTTCISVSTVLFIYVLSIFNTTRYIRLTYTTLAVLLEIIGALLLAIMIVNLINKTNNIKHNNLNSNISSRSKMSQKFTLLFYKKYDYR